jgi:hypothetical protein
MTTPKNPAAAALGRRGGQAKVSKGPNAAKTPEQRAEWAAKMVEARRAKLLQSLPLPRHRPPLLKVDHADLQALDVLVP